MALVTYWWCSTSLVRRLDFCLIFHVFHGREQGWQGVVVWVQEVVEGKVELASADYLIDYLLFGICWCMSWRGKLPLRARLLVSMNPSHIRRHRGDW